MGEGKIFGPLDIEISPKDVAMKEFDIKPLRPPVLNSSMSIETSVHFSTPSWGGGLRRHVHITPSLMLSLLVMSGLQ